jgi:hypothetical protein
MLKLQEVVVLGAEEAGMERLRVVAVAGRWNLAGREGAADARRK